MNSKGVSRSTDSGPAGALPPVAAWQHLDARDGFELAFIRGNGTGYHFSGRSVAVQSGVPWCVAYELTIDGSGATRSAEIRSLGQRGEVALRLESTEAGEWWVNGRHAPALGGCLDVDLEASALTNAFPVRRLGLLPGMAANAPAAFVHASDLRVERLGQRYERLPEDATLNYRYSAPRFDFTATLRYDADGLVLDYPGIAERRL